jgi:hypothetical protein
LLYHPAPVRDQKSIDVGFVERLSAHCTAVLIDSSLTRTLSDPQQKQKLRSTRLGAESPMKITHALILSAGLSFTLASAQSTTERDMKRAGYPKQ